MVVIRHEDVGASQLLEFAAGVRSQAAGHADAPRSPAAKLRLCSACFYQSEEADPC